MRNKLLVAGTLALAMTCTTVFSSITPAVVKAASVSTVQTQTAENSDDYVYCYAGLTWAEYWKAEGVWAAGDTTSSDTADSHGEKDKGAFDAVTRATVNHGLHRGSYQCTAIIEGEKGTYNISHWTDANTAILTNGEKITFTRGAIKTSDGTEDTMKDYKVYGLKYVPVAVKSSDFEAFKAKYSVVENNGTLIGGYGEKNLQAYNNVTASVDKDTNGLKTAEKQSDGSFTFTQRSNGSSSGIKDKTLKTADLNNMGATVKDASGSYGEFLRVDFTKNYGDLGANMQAVKWTYYGNDSTRSKALATYGTKFAADNWMHKSMGIQLGLTNSIRCQLPKGYDGTGYWSLTIYALGYADSTYNFEATDANIVKPDTNAGDTTELNKLVSSVEELKKSDYTEKSWNSFETELNEAKDILAKEAPNQAEVDEALEHLKAAEAALVKVTVALDKTSATIYTGKTVTLKAASNDTAKTVTYTTSNKAVATVSSTGVVKGVKAGTAVITANCGNATATCKVTVKAPSVKFAKKSAVVYKGKTATVKATLAGVSSVTYKSSNTKIATVNSKTGTVKGIKAGTVTITATSGKLKATYKLTVKNPTFTLTKSSATIAKGKTTTIRSKATPVSTVTYTSSNKKVATVTSKGVVKGIRKGKATITVKCNGITKKFVVTVK